MTYLFRHQRIPNLVITPEATELLRNASFGWLFVIGIVNVGYFLTIIEQKPNILMVTFMNHNLMNVIRLWFGSSGPV